MLQLTFPYPKNRQPLKVLFLGAHSDDIEIGCGGTVLRLMDHYEGLSVHWIVFSANAERRNEAEKSARTFINKAVKKEIITGLKGSKYMEITSGVNRGDILILSDVSSFRHMREVNIED